MNLLLLRLAKTSGYLTALSALFCLLAAPAPANAGTRYETGISTSYSLLWMDGPDLNKRLRDIKRLGASWIRVDFSWPAIQPDNASEFHWGKHDRVVRAADKYGLRVLAVLGYTPQWARDPRCHAIASNERSAQACRPRSTFAFGRFARAAAQRYHWQNVRGWEIWNEPNLRAYWKTVQPNNTLFVDPVAYARLANAAAREIRRYSDAAIVTGGLAPLYEPSSSTGMRQSDYLAQALPHLYPQLFDGISIHPYTWPLLPSREAHFNAFYTVNNGRPEYNLRTVMAKAGWGDKQIWGTEFGASTKGKRKSFTKYKRPDHVTEAIQAQIVTKGIGSWYTKPNVGPLFVHSDSDRWLTTHKNENGYGLRRSDNTKKPAYEALQQATQRVWERRHILENLRSRIRGFE